FGRAVEAAEMLRGNTADVERTVIGLDHMVAGKRLAERWELPTNIRDCIWLHGQSPAALPATVSRPRMVNLITLADLIAREMHLGYSGNYVYTLSRQNLLDAVGVTPEQVDATVAKLIDQADGGGGSRSHLRRGVLAHPGAELRGGAGLRRARRRVRKHAGRLPATPQYTGHRRRAGPVGGGGTRMAADGDLAAPAVRPA